MNYKALKPYYPPITYLEIRTLLSVNFSKENNITAYIIWLVFYFFVCHKKATKLIDLYIKKNNKKIVNSFKISVDEIGGKLEYLEGIGMLICKKEFIAGLLMAAISVSAVTNISSLYAVERKYASEVEFSQRIGLFDSERLSEKTLKSNIAEIAFYRGLNLILANKGIVKNFNTHNLESLGITQTTSPMSSLTRQKAAETILRAMIYAQNKGMIKIPENTKKRAFRDYSPEAKYQEMMNYAIEKGVFKGMSRNNFKPNKKLSVREALNFLKNLYELETIKPNSVITEKKTPVATKPQTTVKPQVKTVYIEPDLTKFFNDITPTNPMAETIKKLINAGAFNTVDLNHELNLPKSIKNGDMMTICKDMLTKAGKTDMIGRISEIEKSVNEDDALTRNSLAKIGSVMSDAYPHKDYNIRVNYTDVKEDSPVGEALTHIAKAGIKMGYSDGSFKGNEKVSRYETFSLLGILVGDNVGSKIKVEKVVKTPVQETTNKTTKEKVVVKEQKPQIENKTAPKAEQKTIKYDINDSTKASKMEQQLRDKYDGLTFQQRIEMRKKQFHKILSRESTAE